MIIHREHKLFLVKVIVQKHSVIYIIPLSWCCGSMSCVLCESYTVQNEPEYGCSLCDVQCESHAIRRGVGVLIK